MQGQFPEMTLEDDLGFQSSRITALEHLMTNIAPHKGTISVKGYNLSTNKTVEVLDIGPGIKVDVLGTTAYLKSRYRDFAEIVFVAMSNAQDEEVEINNREFYIAPYTVFRYIIHETNTDGNIYQFQYKSGGTWTNIESSVTTAGSNATTYHSKWRTIPTAVLNIKMPLVRVNRTNSGANIDTSLCVIQLWDGEPDHITGGDSGQPPSSGETLPAFTSDTPTSAPVFTVP